MCAGSDASSVMGVVHTTQSTSPSLGSRRPTVHAGHWMRPLPLALASLQQSRQHKFMQSELRGFLHLSALHTVLSVLVSAWSPVQSGICGALLFSMESLPYTHDMGGSPSGIRCVEWSRYGKTPVVVCPNCPLPILLSVQWPWHRLWRQLAVRLLQWSTVHVELW